MNLIQKEAGQEGFQQHKSHTGKTMASLDLNDTHRAKPNLLRINADNQDKKFMCIFWAILFVFLITISIVAKTLPSAIQTIRNIFQLEGTSLQGCQNPSYFQNDILKCADPGSTTYAVGLVAQKLSSLNQFVIASLIIIPKDMNVSIKLNQTVRYTFYGLSKQSMNGQTVFRKNGFYMNETAELELNSMTDTNTIMYSNDGKSIIGYKLYLGFIGQFPAQIIYINVLLEGPYSELSNIGAMQIQGTKIAKGFTQFTIVIRYIFFVFSLLSGYLYIRKFRKIPLEDRIIQQKLILILSILLFFFNDPFYPITVLKQNIISSFVSTLFIVNFVVFLIFLWVIFFDRIYYEQGQKQTSQITPFKIIYFFILLVLLIVVYMLYADYRLNDHPIVPTAKFLKGKFLVMDIISSIWFGLAMLYLTFQFVRICLKKQQPLWRNQIFILYSVGFMIALMFFVFTDDALGAYYYDGATVIFVYGLMNLYTWYLQYMYSPTKEMSQNEMMGLNADQKMSIQTVQFNDLTINLDDNINYQNFQEQKPVKNQNQNLNQKINKQNAVFNKKNNQFGKDDNKKKDQLGNDDNFSIEDEQIDNKKSNQVNKNGEFKFKQEPVDFFNEQQKQKYQNKVKTQEQTVEKTYNGVVESNRTNLITLNMTSNGNRNPHDVVIPGNQTQTFPLSSQSNIEQKSHELISQSGISGQFYNSNRQQPQNEQIQSLVTVQNNYGFESKVQNYIPVEEQKISLLSVNMDGLLDIQQSKDNVEQEDKNENLQSKIKQLKEQNTEPIEQNKENVKNKQQEEGFGSFTLD